MKYIVAIASLLLASVHTPALAQISSAPDGTNTGVNQAGSTFNITGGTQAGSNLFHSFQQFGLNAGQIANFLSNPAIANILGRVTGGNASIINGRIQVTGSNANLFLMNPAGIVFGANASLNVPGSFTATTANAIGIGNQWFNAVGNNNYAALLGTPNSFAFTGLQPGAIINAGSLAVGTGQSLTLLGGTVINTGTLTAPGGTITIAAIAGEKLVRVTQDGSLLSLDLPIADQALINPLPFVPLALPALLTGGNLGNATGLTVDNDVVKLTGSGIPVAAGDVVAKNVSAGTATLSANNNLTLSESQLHTTGNLNLLANNNVTVRDSVANPVIIQAGKDLTIQGNQGIDILALNHLQSGKPFQAGRNLALISDGVISGDAHFGSGGDFRVQTLSSSPANFISLNDPVISSNGNVIFTGNYTGASLKVEAIGSINFTGSITINNPDLAAIDNNAGDRALLRDGRALILRAGRTVLDNPNNVPTIGFINPGGDTTPGSIFVGGEIASADTTPTAPLTVVLSAVGDITTQAITTSRNDSEGGNIIISSTGGSISTRSILTRRVLNFYSFSPPEGGSVVLSAPNGSITTGNIEAGFSLNGAGNPVGVALNSQGTIQTGNISALRTVQLNSSAGNVVVETIRTATTNFDGTEITVTTPGLFQARGTFTPNPNLNNLLVRRVNIDTSGNEDIVLFLKSQGVLDANGVIVPAVNQPGGVTVPIVSVSPTGQRTIVVDIRSDEIPVSILAGRGDRLPVVRIQHGGRSVDTTQSSDPLGRRFVTIAGSGGSDGTQFVVGGVPTRLAAFTITPNFNAPLVDDTFIPFYAGPALRYQTFSALPFGSDQFPNDVSGTVGAIATITNVTNASLPGSFEGIVFKPTVKPITFPNESSQQSGSVGEPKLATATRDVSQQDFQRQTRSGVCVTSQTIASSTIPETRSPSTPSNPCGSAKDDAQILKILGEDAKPNQSRYFIHPSVELAVLKRIEPQSR